jgi:spore germination protein KC
MQGNIGEINCKVSHDMHDVPFLHSVEQAVAREVEQNVQEFWTFQQRLGIDIPRVKARLKGYHPFAWKKIEDRWAEIYPSIPLIVSVNVNIRAVGEHD